MTISVRNGHGDPCHNDRSKNKGHNIDQTKTPNNEIYKQGSFLKCEESLNLEAQERQKYEALFSEWLQAQNEKHLSTKHPKRVKTMKQIYELARYTPHELVLQVGNYQDYPAIKDVRSIMTEFIDQMQRKYRPNLKLLNAVMHLDEATPHVHLRYVMCAHDKDGHLYPAFDKGLKELNIAPQSRYADEAQGRYNNRSIGFTDRLRDEFALIAEQHIGEISRGEHVGEKHRQGRDFLLERDRAFEQRQLALTRKDIELSAMREKLDNRKKELRAVVDTLTNIEKERIKQEIIRQRKQEWGMER